MQSDLRVFGHKMLMICRRVSEDQCGEVRSHTYLCSAQ